MDSPWPQQSRYYILSWLGTPRTLRVCGGPFFILVTNSHNLSVYGLPLKQAIKIRQLELTWDPPNGRWGCVVVPFSFLSQTCTIWLSMDSPGPSNHKRARWSAEGPQVQVSGIKGMKMDNQQSKRFAKQLLSDITYALACISYASCCQKRRGLKQQQQNSSGLVWTAFPCGKRYNAVPSGPSGPLGGSWGVGQCPRIEKFCGFL